MPSPLRDFLASTELFGGLGAADLDDVERELSVVRRSGGELLFREGEPADCLYVVRSGRLRALMKQEDGSERVVGEIGRGEVVGELALLTGGSRSASVLAVRDSELLRFSEAGFERLLKAQPQAAMSLAKKIVARSQQAMRASGKRRVPATIAIVPASKDLELPHFVADLEAALEAHGTTLRLDSASMEAALGGGTAATTWAQAGRSRIVEWLNEQETTHRFVVYVADPGASVWTDYALRQADHVIVVGAAERPPEPGVTDLAKAHGFKELVLVHSERRLDFTGTSRWLAAFAVSRHHHILRGAKADIQRVVRFITGRAVALVLGGGGARGFAHIGVVRALEEAGIPIDIVGGTSMGSFIGAQVALGLDSKMMRESSDRFWNKNKPFNDYTIPWISIVRNKRYLKAARELFGDVNIEDLWLNYFAVASDLTRATISAPREGSLLKWVGASMAIPGIVAPVFERGDLFVDGGVLDNVPIDVMLGRCEGVVIAVDVSPREDLAVDPELTGSPRGWKILWSRFSPWADKRIKIPTLFDILSRVTSLSSVQTMETVKKSVDLYMHPPTEGYGILEFDGIDEIIELGYRHAQDNMAQLRSLLPELKNLGPAAAPTRLVVPRRRRSGAWLRAAAALVLALIFWHHLPSLVDRALNRVRSHPPASKRAGEFIRTIPICDLHADSVLWGRPLLSHNYHGQVDIPRLIRGHVVLQVFGIVTQMPRHLSGSNDGRSDWVYWLSWAGRWPWKTHDSFAARALYQAQRLREYEEQSRGSFVLIRSAAELATYLDRRDQNPRMTAGLLAVEGAQALEGQLGRLDEFSQAGVRMMAPTHFTDTEIGGSAHGAQKGGLTPMGRRWVLEMEKRRMIIDLAHASPQTIADVLALAKRPVVISHTGVRATCDNQRNLSDDQLRAVAKNDGLVGIGYWEMAVCGTDAAAVARAIRHAADVAGVAHVALGSDFDGAVVAPFDAAHLDVLVDALLAQGFKENEVRRIMGENTLEFLAKNLP